MKKTETERNFQWIGWIPIAVLPVAAAFCRNLLKPWEFMWCLCFAIFAGLKWLTWWKARSRVSHPNWRSVAYLLAWPGMNAEAFLDQSRHAALPAWQDWLAGILKAALGAALAMLPYVPGTHVKIALMMMGVALPSAIYIISNAVVGEITPAAQRGALLAIGAAVAGSAGLLAPYIMGSVIESATTPLDGFNTGFFMCGIIMLVGGAIAIALVNPEREGVRLVPRVERAIAV